MYKTLAKYLIVLVPVLSFSTNIAHAWHGKTHKKLTQDAIEILYQQDIPQDEKSFFSSHKESLYRGSVNADKYSRLHHMDFLDSEEISDDSAAATSEEISEIAIDRIHQARLAGEVTEVDMNKFAEACGEVGHMIEDMANGFHTLSNEDQAVHNELEAEVNKDIRKNRERFESEIFQTCFDGEFRRGIAPYDAVTDVAETSYFGDDEILPARKLASSVPMGKYGTGSYVGLKKGWKPPLIKSVSESLNIAVNSTAECFDYMYTRAFLDDPQLTNIETPGILQIQTTPIHQQSASDTYDSVQK